jgi:hypothetical protein
MYSIQTKHTVLDRDLNTKVNGTPFDQRTIDSVWEKAVSVWGFLYFRKDVYGAPIAKQDFGMLSKYGWEIDHIIPVTQGGTDDPENLRPLHWMNNRIKGETYPMIDNPCTINAVERNGESPDREEDTESVAM